MCLGNRRRPWDHGASLLTLTAAGEAGWQVPWVLIMEHVLGRENCRNNQSHLPLTEPVLLPDAGNPHSTPVVKGRAARVERTKVLCVRGRREAILKQEGQMCIVGFQTLQDLKNTGVTGNVGDRCVIQVLRIDCLASAQSCPNSPSVSLASPGTS